MSIIREADAVPYRIHGAVFHSFVAPATGGEQLCAWRLEVAGGTPGQPHRVTHEEILLLLAGRLTLTVDGVAGELAPGEAVRVPAGASFCLDNPSAEPATAWVTTSVGLRATLADGTHFTPPWVQ